MNSRTVNTLALLLGTACLSVAFAEVKKPSSEVQAKIGDKLQQSSRDDLMLFDKDGVLEKKTALNTDLSVDSYKSLPDLLNSNKSPIDDCKKPTPTPPPGCVVCGDGRIVCSKAFRVQSKKPKSMLDSPKPDQPQ